MKKLPPIDPAILAMAAAAVRAAWDAGCPVATAPEEKAHVAIRRWRTSQRRGISQDDMPARIRDMAMGFVDQFEKDRKLVGPLIVDYEYLAGEIAKVLSK